MLAKFESKSNRVKGLAFHPRRPWLLASLHNATIQLWDYQMGTLLDKFDEHEGPVRGVAFHPNQPLFVSGGDDYRIKVWNWKSRRCLFTLTGHLDYVRTVFFHPENPWIISASDDQTVRIWNWQSRSCIAVLTGHNHYVMCAQFHPKEDLVVSASLDQTIRVWDISGLKKKPTTQDGLNLEALGISASDLTRRPGQPGDLFGVVDGVMVKFVLEGHDRGVNWVSFHPTLPLIISGADDRQVKLWRMSESKAWEVDTCRGHFNNVSCVAFHPTLDVIISNSEDKTIRVWDMNKRTAIHTFRREHDRFWVLAAHPHLGLFAAGHDNGLVVFKLERERPAATVVGDQVIYIKDKFVRVLDVNTGNDNPVVTLTKSGTPLAPSPKTVSYNPAEQSILLSTPGDQPSYELFNLAKQMRFDGKIGDSPTSSLRGTGTSAVFVARNRFAVMDASKKVTINDLKNEATKSFNAPANTESISYAGMKSILLITTTSVILYDAELRQNTAELPVSSIRQAFWSSDLSMVAFIAKHAIVIANKKLEQLCIIHETVKIKSGAWDDAGVFVYTTLNHIKYLLPHGDNGIIKTLDTPLYIMRVKNRTIFCIDRNSNVCTVEFDPTEYMFKLALVRQDQQQIMYLIQNSNLIGQAIIGYVRKKGYAEIALHFVKDPKTRFDLALECGNMDVAVETAKIVDRSDCWTALGNAALKQGNHDIVEMCYQRNKQFEKLSMLYLITGNVEKLKKMMKISEMRNDTPSRYQNSVMLGDVKEQVTLLIEMGQVQLAYLTAKTHGLDQEAEAILAEVGSNPPKTPPGDLLMTPTPILKLSKFNWPNTKGGLSLPNPANRIPTPEFEDNVQPKESNGWNAEILDIPADDFLTPEPVEEVVEEGPGWDIDGDLDIEEAPPSPGKKDVPRIPTVGTNVSDVWARNSGLAADHIAAGNFESAMQLLNRQAGIVNFAPLKPFFMEILTTTRTYLSCNSNIAGESFPLYRQWSEDNNKILPYLPLNGSSLKTQLDEAFQLTTSGKFPEAMVVFKNVLYSAIFTLTSDPSEVADIVGMIHTCKEYLLGLRMETARKELNPETQGSRALELAAYFTHCQLQNIHAQLSIRSAMAAAYKLKNYGHASLFARRLLELDPPAHAAQQARQLQARCDRNPTDELQINYDAFNPFVLCAMTFTPIYQGSPHVVCAFCQSKFKPEFKGKACPTCNIAEIGLNATGLRQFIK